MASCKALLLLIITFLSSLFFLTVHSTADFHVGGEEGWVVPPSKDEQLYNEWASKNRFNVNDTLHFAYKKDSVLVVTDKEYDKCHSVHPMFFSNNGQTAFILDRPGLFYFISGVSGHCERGMKMIIKVLDPESPPQSANQTTEHNSGTTEMASAMSTATFVLFTMSFFGTLFA
ncbi:early nodulin-like protein 5 [Cornus florida]|uniref:early nodulin-like protein 5 n=1 Tax=Cornus florida TaxID=4283 RepID=UPI00289BC32E|nr:early nodulin-like protein 5 [Cornus florida]